MIPISFIKKNKKKILNILKKRNFYKLYLIDKILFLDLEKKNKEEIIKEKKIKLKKIYNNYKNDKYDKYIYIKNIKKKKQEIKLINEELNKIKLNIFNKIIQIPNIFGYNNENKENKINNNENKIIYENNFFYSKKKKYFSHLEIGKKLNILDFEIGSKISGSGFPIFIGKGAKLKRSLIQFFLDMNIKYGYKEFSFPYLVNEKSVFYTGQFPDKENQMYYLKKEKLYLIPTGEVPLINYYQNKILLEKSLPIKNTTYTSCFRREAGSYGSKVKGLNRIHQFDKVEIIQITKNNLSYIALKEMINHIKNILNFLKIKFRIIKLCYKNLGISSYETYDFEVYSLYQKKWLEVSSVSNCTEYQSRRLNLKYKNKKNNNNFFCHTLNGSSLALPRLIIALLENNLEKYKDKWIVNIPEVLIPYTGFNKIINN